MGGILNPAVFVATFVGIMVIRMGLLVARTHPQQKKDMLAQQQRMLRDLRRKEHELYGVPGPDPEKVAAIRRNAESNPAQYPLAS